MENWQYAFGVRLRWSEPRWINESEPGSYADAELALTLAVAADDPMSDCSLNEPCIVKRSDHHPHWQPVHDHAAELLAETLGKIARDINRTNPRVSPTQATAFVLATAAKALVPNTASEEYDA